ncbi:hypothetical protein KO02_12250 [Sphingobacterium sp. ML3W]|uniref:hypothetical protein n=1 Tax=Sphingobacterium sp. ML3W TaxID=1538644 RepID=UPI0004F669F4|nr:hypothetical protein [Sphingobacterium sp. ML3W]AIM37376.1 hypothetical protein KO02_12250 [Sphingobacterium sp. ML3W]
MATFKTDKLIRELCKETGGLRKYNSMLGFLLLGIKDLLIFTVPFFREQEVKVNRFNSVPWPKDCIQPLALGIKCNGRIMALDVDASIMSGNHTAAHKSVSNYENDIDAFYSGNTDLGRLNVTSAGLGEWYGYDGNYNSLGYVNHDKNSRLSHIVGRVRTGDCLVMYYKSDGLEDCPDELPSEIESALVYFMLHRHELTNRPTIAEIHRKNYKEEVMRLRKFYQSGSIDDWVSAIRSNSKSSPR